MLDGGIATQLIGKGPLVSDRIWRHCRWKQISGALSNEYISNVTLCHRIAEPSGC
jgi:hypothetical protein